LPSEVPADASTLSAHGFFSKFLEELC